MKKTFWTFRQRKKKVKPLTKKVSLVSVCNSNILRPEDNGMRDTLEKNFFIIQTSYQVLRLQPFQGILFPQAVSEEFIREWISDNLDNW